MSNPPKGRPVSTPTPLDTPLNDDSLVTYASGNPKLGVNYLWRGAHNAENQKDYLGDLIQTLQRGLDRANGATTGSDDGIYGKGTAEAVRKLQAKYGLAQDGIAGRQTITALQVAELAKVVDGKNAEAISFEAADVDAMLVKGKPLPVKVKAEIKAIIGKIEGDVKLAADSELAKTVASIKDKAGLAK